jgi:hypothetical protein
MFIQIICTEAERYPEIAFKSDEKHIAEDSSDFSLLSARCSTP